MDRRDTMDIKIDIKYHSFGDYSQDLRYSIDLRDLKNSHEILDDVFSEVKNACDRILKS